MDSNATIEQVIAQSILKNGNIKTVIETDELTRYNGGVFHKGRLAMSEIREQITSLASYITIPVKDSSKPYNCSISKRNEIVEIIKSNSFVSLSEFDVNDSRINALNGHLLYNDGEWGFFPHYKYDESPYLSFVQIPIIYEPDAECLKIDQFLSDIFGFERVPDVYEMISYFLMPTVKYQKAFILYGPPKTGKTSFINLIFKFIGGLHPHRLISQVSLQDLEERFRLANLRDKLLNIYDDLKATKLTSQGKFRMSVTNSTITAEVKYLPYDITWKNVCKNLFSCNQLPSVPRNTGDEFWRRWKLFDCFNEFNINCDLEFVNMNWSQEELSGLLNKCMEAWIKLEARQHFLNDDIEYIKGIWQMDIEPAKLFVDAKCFIGPNSEIEVDTFWNALNRYRKEFNGPPISKTMCTQSLQRISDQISKPKRRKDNVHFYEGITIRDVILSSVEGGDQPIIDDFNRDVDYSDVDRF